MEADTAKVDELSKDYQNLALYIYVFFVLHEHKELGTLAKLKREIAEHFRPVERDLTQCLHQLNLHFTAIEPVLRDTRQKEVVLKKVSKMYLQSIEKLLYSKAGDPIDEPEEAPEPTENDRLS